MEQEFMAKDLEEAKSEMIKYRHSMSPLTTFLLIMDYSQMELDESIRKIDLKTMDRLEPRFELARHLLGKQQQRLYINEDKKHESLKIPTKQFTIKTAAIEIGVSEGTIRNAISGGKLNYSNVSGTGNRKNVRISQKDIDEYRKHKK
jgi:hypothetical protein